MGCEWSVPIVVGRSIVHRMSFAVFLILNIPAQVSVMVVISTKERSRM